MQKITKRQITEKMDVIVMDSQGDCMNDCERTYWTGENAVIHLVNNTCSKNIQVDAVFSTKR